MSDRIPVPEVPAERKERNRRLRTPEGWSGAECLICKRPIRDDRKAVYVHLTTSYELVPVDTDPEDSQGCWPVGPECARKVPATYRQKWDSKWEGGTDGTI